MSHRSTLLIQTVLVALCVEVVPRASATDGKWNVNAAGNWSNAANWTNSQIPGDVVGSVASISYNITANRTVTVDQPVTLGRLRFNDDTTASHDWTLASSGGNMVTLQVSSGIPIIDVGNRTANFNSTLLLGGSQGFMKIGGGTLNLANTANNNLLGGNIIMGGGILALSNPSMSNSFAGKYIVTNGVLRVTSEPCVGPYPASYVADLITLKTGAYLMNNSSDVTLDANIGITVDATGGGIQAGWGRFLTINGIITGPGALTLRCDATPGAISLNATNAYTGQTIIGNTTANNWCWVLVNGSLSAASTVQVYTNGSLGGFGTVNGPVTVRTNGILSPGGISTPGTLTINNDVIITNGCLKIDLGNTTTVGAGVNDLLQINGNLTVAGTITVTFNAVAGSLANGTYRLMNYTGTADLAGATFVCDNPRLGATFDISIPGQINVTIANGTPANLVWTGINSIYWDVATTTNFLDNTTPTVFYQGDAVTFDDTGAYVGGVSLAAATGPNFGTIQPAAITVITTNDFTLTSAGNARLGGGMSLYKGGTGVLTLSQANNNNPNIYDGLTVVTNGTLKIGNGRVLGTTNSGTIVTNLGQFDTSGQGGIYEPMVLQGSGPDGSGVVVNTGSSTVNDGLHGPVTLAGDVTLGGSGRFDILNGGLQGNGYKITKISTNEIALENETETGIGNIDVNAGQLTLLGTILATSPGSRVAVVSNAVFAFWALNNTADTPFVKDIALTNGNFRSNSGTNYYSGTVTLDSTNGITSTAQMSLLGPVVGPGALNKVGAGVLELDGANTYSGVTLVGAGTLTLGPNATLANTPLISVTNGATLDVSQPATGLQLATGQTLAGSGTVNGNVSASPGSTLAPGSSPGTLTINGTLALNNAFLPFELGSSPFSGSDQIIAAGVLPAGVNTIKIIPTAALDTVNPYTLINDTGAPMASGSETKFTVTTDSRYNFSLIPTATSLGYYLQVQVSGSGSPALLIWQGADPVNPANWDLQTTSNWLNGATVDRFYSGDTAVFDDSAIGTTANIIGTIQPAAVLLSNVSKSITLSGSGALVTATLQAEGAGTTTLANSSANQFANGVTVDAGTLVIANSAANDFGPALSVYGGTLAFNQPINATVSTPLAGYGALRKDNTNTLTLTGANSSFSGPINVNNGALCAGSTTALGDVNVPMNVNPGGSLNVNGLNLGTKIVNAAGTGYNGTGAIMNTGANQNNALQQVVLSSDAVFGGPNRWDIRGSSTVYGALNMANGGTYSITKIGSQQFSLVNVVVAATLGDIDVQEGTLSYESGTTGLGDPTRTVTVHSNATLFFYSSTNAVDKRIELNGGSTVRVNNGTANRVVGATTLSEGVVTLNGGSGYTLYLDGPIGGVGGLLKNEQCTFSLGNSNFFTGDVQINRGNLVLSNSFAAGTNKTIAINYNIADTGGNGTRLYLRGGITTPDDVVGLYSALNFPGDYRCSVTSDVLTNTWAGPTVLEGSGIVGFYRNNASAGFNITGPIYGTNGFTGVAFFRGSSGYGGLISGKVDLQDGVLAITDNSAWAFSNPANAWTTNRIAYGRFILGADNAGVASAVFELGQPGTSSGILDLNGFNQTAPLIYTLNGSNHSITNGSSAADSVFTYAGGSTPSTFDGRIVNGARNVSLTVNSGTLTLLGNNTYKGNTLLNGGRLALGPAAALANTPLITLQSGATLDSSAIAAGLTLASGQTLTGNGTVEGSLTVGSGATLSVGTSIGSMTVTNVLSFAAGSTNVVELNISATPACDVANAASVVYGGTLVVNNLGPALTAGSSFKLFNAASYAGAFNQLIPAVPAMGLRWDTSTLAVDGTLRVGAVSMAPTGLSVVQNPGRLDFSWPTDHTGWRLEAQTNSAGIDLSISWVTIPGSAATNAVSIGVDPNVGAAFFRLVYP